MTRRDRQRDLKRGGKPWEVAKAFDASAPIGPVVPLAETGHLARGAVTLAVNRSIRQSGDLSDLIWHVAALIAELSRGVELKAGDLIFTGTPAGVAPVARGDELCAAVAGLPALRLRIV
jgi:2-keto-4-pentenoate hydratase/2-oxohepta-3-ene-1,7-dioic acid hydratase (catechol pathway)